MHLKSVIKHAQNEIPSIASRSSWRYTCFVQSPAIKSVHLPRNYANFSRGTLTVMANMLDHVWRRIFSFYTHFLSCVYTLNTSNRFELISSDRITYLLRKLGRKFQTKRFLSILCMRTRKIEIEWWKVPRETGSIDRRKTLDTLRLPLVKRLKAGLAISFTVNQRMLIILRED